MDLVPNFTLSSRFYNFHQIALATSSDNEAFSQTTRAELPLVGMRITVGRPFSRRRRLVVVGRSWPTLALWGRMRWSLWRGLLLVAPDSGPLDIRSWGSITAMIISINMDDRLSVLKSDATAPDGLTSSDSSLSTWALPSEIYSLIFISRWRHHTSIHPLVVINESLSSVVAAGSVIRR